MEDRNKTKQQLISELAELRSRMAGMENWKNQFKLAEKVIKMAIESAVEEKARSLPGIKTIKGLLPICASCKNIRDEKGSWNQFEDYMLHHAEIEFSHSICPECVKKLYPQYQPKNPQ